MRIFNLVIFLILFSVPHLYSQKLSTHRYWVSFTDKAGSPYSVNSPGEFLSQRSILRRSMQGIQITSEDLPVSPVYVSNLRNLGATVLGTSKWFNAAIIETSDASVLSSIRLLPFVKNFNPGVPVRLSAMQSNSPLPEMARRFPLSVTQDHYGLSDKQVSLLNGKAVHELGFRGEGMVIAVFDAGFFQADVYPAFDTLWADNRIIDWHDFGHPPVVDFFRGDSHGMSVLSTMGGNIPGEIIGTAPDASYILLRSEISGSETPVEEAWWAMAAEYADSAGADIINSSLGYSTFDDSAFNYTRNDLNGKTALSTLAAEKAFSKGMIVVVSAGNEGNDRWEKITFPSDGKNVISVGAIDTSLYLASFSSTGPSADNRVKPDVVAVGLKAAVYTASGTTGYANGTSFSAPQIAGMVACLWQGAPDKKNIEIVNAVRRASSNYYYPDKWFGYGLPDFLLALNQLNSTPQLSKNELHVIPNPNTGIFEIRLEDPDDRVTNISIFSITGALVRVITNPEILSGYIRISGMSYLQPGIYFITIKTTGKSYIAKFVKI